MLHCPRHLTLTCEHWHFQAFAIFNSKHADEPSCKAFLNCMINIDGNTAEQLLVYVAILIFGNAKQI